MAKPLVNLQKDPWFRGAIALLYFAGIGYSLTAVVASISVPLAEAPPDRLLVGFLSTGLCLGFPVLLMGIACVVCGRGLQKRKPWAYVGGIVFGALLLGCLPVGGAILYGLLRPGVKDAYRDEGTR